jgi:hypothetical protein
MLMNRSRMAVAAVAALAGFTTLSAQAAITVDGTRDLDYGAPIVVQTVQTQFGDAMPPGDIGGSELDAAYARVEGGRLFLLFTGNHEPNFNKLEVFIDSRPGGENTLSSTPDYDFNGGGGWNSSNLGGLTFDNIAGPDGSAIDFTADFHLFSAWGSSVGPYNATFIDRQGGGSAMVPGSSGSGSNAVGLVSTGAILAGNVANNASGTALTQNLDFAINDNNAAGVIGGTGAANAANAAAVTTGMEFSIALVDLGNPAPGTTIYISAMINNGDHNFLSNQVLGGLPAGAGNLGGDGAGAFTGSLSAVNFNQFSGLQYFAVTVPRVIPEPAGLTLLGLGAAVLLPRRRSRGHVHQPAPNEATHPRSR